MKGWMLLLAAASLCLRRISVEGKAGAMNQVWNIVTAGLFFLEFNFIIINPLLTSHVSVFLSLPTNQNPLQITLLQVWASAAPCVSLFNRFSEVVNSHLLSFHPKRHTQLLLLSAFYFQVPWRPEATQWKIADSDISTHVLDYRARLSVSHAYGIVSGEHQKLSYAHGKHFYI